MTDLIFLPARIIIPVEAALPLAVILSTVSKTTGRRIIDERVQLVEEISEETLLLFRFVLVVVVGGAKHRWTVRFAHGWGRRGGGEPRRVRHGRQHGDGRESYLGQVPPHDGGTAIVRCVNVALAWLLRTSMLCNRQEVCYRRGEECAEHCLRFFPEEERAVGCG